MSRIYYRGARAAIVCYGKPTLPVSCSISIHSQVLSRMSNHHNYKEPFVMHNFSVVTSVEQPDSVVVSSDLTDSSSFQRARFWVKELQNCEEVRELQTYDQASGKLTTFQRVSEKHRHNLSVMTRSMTCVHCNCQIKAQDRRQSLLLNVLRVWSPAL